MTIKRGEEWGAPGALADTAPEAATDAELAALVSAAVLARLSGGSGAIEGPGPVEVGLLGGDLCRTVAGPGDRARLRTPAAQRLPVDAGVVALDDGPELVFVAHVVAGRRLLGPVVAAMNAQFVGRFDVAPRSHPNDGRLDLVDARLGAGDRWKAWRRLPQGTHVPHPAISERRVTDAVVDLGGRLPVRVDGRRVGHARVLRFRAVPDAFTIVI